MLTLLTGSRAQGPRGAEGRRGAMPKRFCTMYEKCDFLRMGYISAFTQARMFVCDLKL